MELTQRMQNQIFLDALTSGDERKRKEAQDIASEYVQKQAHEGGILRNVLPPEVITVQDLDPQVGYEEPTKLFPKEPDTPACVRLPFGAPSETIEPVGDRGLVVMYPVMSPHMLKNKNLLLTYEVDIRTIMGDILPKKMMELEDATFIAQVDNLLGSAGTVISEAGVALHQQISGGLTSKTWVDAMQIMPRADSRFRPHTVVLNQATAMELMSWGANDLGETLADEITEKGIVRDRFRGVNLVVTIQNDIVADNVMYIFARPNQLGKFYILQDITMYTDVKGSDIEWWYEEVIGASIQVLGCAKATFV